MAETEKKPEVKEEKKELIAKAKELPPLTEPFSLRPRSFDEAFRFANLIAESDLIPPAFQKKPANVLIAVQLGMELGVAPMQALQSMYVVNGRPAIFGDLLPAIVFASGLLEEFEEQGDENEARCTVKRRGFAPITRAFTMAEAKKAGLPDKNPTYGKYPKRMLAMRARAFAFRDMFADVLKGVAVVEDIEDSELRDVTPAKAAIAPPQRRSEQKEDVDAQPEPSQEEPKQEAKEEAKGQEEGPVDTSEVIALREIAGYTKDTLPPPNALNRYMKGQPGKVQSTITAAYNARKKELGL